MLNVLRAWSNLKAVRRFPHEVFAKSQLRTSQPPGLAHKTALPADVYLLTNTFIFSISTDFSLF